ncbi:MAG: polyamine aminopropyltransferase [Acidobacteriota bacterium]
MFEIREALDPRDGWTQVFEVEEVLAHRKTPFHELIIFDNPLFGRVLMLDGVVQTTESDEYIYHEMLVHVPLLAHGAARRVLIIGGGDGGALREVLRHPTVAHVTLVEIDAEVVAAAREYLPCHSSGGFDDPRAELVIADGASYVAETDGRFDIVLVDSTDPSGPGKSVFTEAFYTGCRRLLGPEGVLTFQGGTTLFEDEALARTVDRLRPHFADVSYYLTMVPSYLGGAMALGWASDDRSMRQVSASVLAERLATAGFEARHYSPAVHVGAFALPPSLERFVTPAR